MKPFWGRQSTKYAITGRSSDLQLHIIENLVELQAKQIPNHNVE